jgi:hypothetical protein
MLKLVEIFEGNVRKQGRKHLGILFTSATQGILAWYCGTDEERLGAIRLLAAKAEELDSDKSIAWTMEETNNG